MSGCLRFLQRTSSSDSPIPSSALLSPIPPLLPTPYPHRTASFPRNAKLIHYYRIGDYAPERPLFQILIAITSGPRFLLILLGWLVSRQRREDLSGKKNDDADVIGRKGSGRGKREGKRGLSRADWVALVGVARTFTWYALPPFCFPYHLKRIVAADGSTSRQQITTVSPHLLLPSSEYSRESSELT
jgi:hypothetical protein